MHSLAPKPGFSTDDGQTGTHRRRGALKLLNPFSPRMWLSFVGWQLGGECITKWLKRIASLNHRFTIVMHSPLVSVGTGLQLCPQEKKGCKAARLRVRGRFLRSGLTAYIAEFGLFPEILRAIREDFSAIQTVWRRERDSNPRYGFPYSGFQDHPFQPLTHPSGGVPKHSAFV